MSDNQMDRRAQKTAFYENYQTAGSRSFKPPLKFSYWLHGGEPGAKSDLLNVALESGTYQGTAHYERRGFQGGSIPLKVEQSDILVPPQTIQELFDAVFKSGLFDVVYPSETKPPVADAPQETWMLSGPETDIQTTFFGEFPADLMPLRSLCKSLIDEAQLNAPYFLAAKHDLARGESLLSNRLYPASTVAFRQGIESLGDHYVNADANDDSGLKLTAADSELEKGNSQVAAHLLQNVLKSRISLYEVNHSVKVASDAYMINGHSVSKDEFNAAKAGLKEISGTHFCVLGAEGNGNINGYEAMDSTGRQVKVSLYMDRNVVVRERIDYQTEGKKK